MEVKEDGFEEWDADFLDQLIQVEELALASTNLTQQKPPQPQPPAAPVPYRSILPPSPPQRPPEPPSYYQGPPSGYRNVIDVSYSPPRELSQRVPDSSDGLAAQSLIVQESEVDRLKKELGRVTKQLSSLEKECVELRKERDKKRPKSVLSGKESRTGEHDCAKTQARSEKSLVRVKDEPGISPKCQNANAMSEHASSIYKKGYRAIGIQTGGDDDLPNSRTKEDSCVSSDLRIKLQSVWSLSHSISSRNSAGKLLQLCAPDICALFGCLGLDVPLRTMESLENNHSARITLARNIQSNYSYEAAKIFEFFSILMMISDDMGSVEALLGVLVDLCRLENVLIAYRSLRIMHVVLVQVMDAKRKQIRRGNVMIERLHPEDDVLDIYGSEKQGSQSETSASSSVSPEERMNVARLHEAKGKQRYVNPLLFHQVDLAQLFQAMCTIAKESAEKQVQVEAVSIMNSILSRSNALSGREKFGETSVFDAVACLLRKEAGLPLQNEAVHLLHLLVNCPKLLSKYICVHGDGGDAKDGANSSSSQPLDAILEGLADCIDQCGNSVEGINLRRTAVGVLAFLAASGKTGLEIVLLHKLSNGANFLGLILRALASEIDYFADASQTSPTLDTSKERAFFMREALILLNRLASHPSYSGMVLKILTSSRDMASLTIDVATRLSSEISFTRERPSRSDNMTKHIRQSEVVDLARIFRKRVYTFLGESSAVEPL